MIVPSLRVTVCFTVTFVGMAMLVILKFFSELVVVPANADVLMLMSIVIRIAMKCFIIDRILIL